MDDYTAALHEHRRILREAFGAHDGVEVDPGEAAQAADLDAVVAAAEQVLAGGIPAPRT